MGTEKDFYINHTKLRIGRISESIDVDYVNKKAQLTATTAAVEIHKMKEQYALEEVGDKNDNMNSCDVQLDLRSMKYGQHH